MSFLGLNSPGNQAEYDAEEQKTTNSVGCIVFVLLLGVGLTVGVFVFYDMHSANRTHEWLESNGTRVSAKCVDNFYGSNYCTQYEFTVGETTYRGIGTVKYLQPSNQEDIFYDPANPNISRLAKAQPPHDLGPMYFGLIVTLVLVVLTKLFVEPLVSKIMKKT